MLTASIFDSGWFEGVVSGLGSGLVVWWLVTKAVVPRIRMSQLEKQPEGYYGLRVENLPTLRIQRWRVPSRDVKVTAKLHCVGIDPSRPNHTINYVLPVSGGMFDRMKNSHNVRLLPKGFDASKLPLLRNALQSKAEQLKRHADLDVSGVDLPWLLEVGTLRVTVTAMHSFTNAIGRTEKTYDKTAIANAAVAQQDAQGSSGDEEDDESLVGLPPPDDVPHNGGNERGG